MTNYQGDQNGHPVYLTVGNLAGEVRNSNVRPRMILLGLLPIVKDRDLAMRSRIFYECLKVMFDPIIRYTDAEGLNVLCADGLERRCYPILVVISVDHEEQVKLTGVKANSYYTMYKVALKERKDLKGWAEWRT